MLVRPPIWIFGLGLPGLIYWFWRLHKLKRNVQGFESESISQIIASAKKKFERLMSKNTDSSSESQKKFINELNLTIVELNKELHFFIKLHKEYFVSKKGIFYSNENFKNVLVEKINFEFINSKCYKHLKSIIFDGNVHLIDYYVDHLG